MRETNQVEALYALISLLMLPALLLLFFGVRNWINGYRHAWEDKLRLGKMLTLFGVIFLVILLICGYFLKGTIPG